MCVGGKNRKIKSPVTILINQEVQTGLLPIITLMFLKYQGILPHRSLAKHAKGNAISWEDCHSWSRMPGFIPEGQS